MKTVRLLLPVLLIASSAIAQLDPQTFELKTTLRSQPGWPSGRVFSLEYHPGPPDTNTTWLVALQIYGGTLGTNSLPASLGTLSCSGVTFRVVLLHEPGNYTNAVYGINEVYIPYPFLSNAVVRLNQAELATNAVTVAYRQDIYSNSVTATLAPETAAAFFRMWSPDNDPKNAIIQVCTNGLGGPWSEVQKK